MIHRIPQAPYPKTIFAKLKNDTTRAMFKLKYPFSFHSGVEKPRNTDENHLWNMLYFMIGFPVKLAEKSCNNCLCFTTFTRQSVSILHDKERIGLYKSHQQLEPAVSPVSGVWFFHTWTLPLHTEWKVIFCVGEYLIRIEKKLAFPRGWSCVHEVSSMIGCIFEK